MHWARIRRNAERKTLHEACQFPQRKLAAKIGIVQTGNGGRPGTSLNFSFATQKTGEKAVSCQAGGQPAPKQGIWPFGRHACANHKTDTFFACGGERTGCAGRQGQGVRQVQTIEIGPVKGIVAIVQRQVGAVNLPETGNMQGTIIDLANFERSVSFAGADCRFWPAAQIDYRRISSLREFLNPAGGKINDIRRKFFKPLVKMFLGRNQDGLAGIAGADVFKKGKRKDQIP